MRPSSWHPALVVAISLATAQAATASLVTLTGGSLGISLAGLPPALFPLNVSAAPISVSSGGSFTEPAGIFAGTVNFPTSLFTGVPLISDLTLGNVANSTKFVAQGAAGGGPQRESFARAAASAVPGRSRAPCS